MNSGHDYHVPLYWNLEFWNAQSINWSAVHENRNDIFYIDHNNIGLSGFIGSFGGPNPILSLESPGEALVLLQKFEEQAHKKGLERLEIRLPPSTYFPAYVEAFSATLFNQGWTISKEELLSYIDLSIPLNSLLNRNRRRDLKYWDTQGIQFHFGDNAQARQIHNLITQNRHSKNREMSLNFSVVSRLLTLFPESVWTCGIYQERNPLSGAILLRLNQSTLYVSHWGSDPMTSNDAKSAITPLFKGIYEFAVTENFSYICLGTSTASDGIDQNLHLFKKSLGALDDYKLTYKKALKND